MATQFSWCVFLPVFFFGSLAIYSSDKMDSLRNGLVVAGCFAAIALPLALWVFFRGARKTLREFKLLRTAPVVAGRVSDMSQISVTSHRGRTATQFVYEVEYTIEDGKLRIIKQYHIDDRCADAAAGLASMGFQREAIAVFYDPKEPTFATTPINLSCKFDEQGVAVQNSTYFFVIRFGGPVLFFIGLLSFLVMLILALLG
jgi:hypothetical protein